MNRQLWVCPRQFDGRTVTILGSGPSLCDEDIDVVARSHFIGATAVIALNSTFRQANWSDVLYGCDAAWWNHNTDALAFSGPKIGLSQVGAEPWPVEVNKLKLRQHEGIETDPRYVAGRNSGHQAINLAVHLGARKVVLLGFDFCPAADGRNHHHADHLLPLKNPTAAVYASWCCAIETTVAPLRQLGVEIVNCSRVSAIACFQRAALTTSILER